MTVMNPMVINDSDVETLCKAFANSLNADRTARLEAESTLETASSVKGFLFVLISIISKPNTDETVRTSAAVYFKNHIFVGWEGRSGTVELNDLEKSQIRNLLLPLVEAVLASNTPRAASKAITETIKFVARRDYPTAWPGILEACVEGLKQRESVVKLGASLIVMRCLAKQFEYKSSKDDLTALVETIGACFKPLLDLAGDLCKKQENWAADSTSAGMVKLLCKCYWSLTQYAIAGGAIVLETLPQWMEFLHYVIIQNIPTSILDMGSGVLQEERWDTLEQVKSKRWALQIVHRWLLRYGTNYQSCTAQAKELGKQFSSDYAPKILIDLIEILQLNKANQFYLNNRMKRLCLQYLRLCLDSSSLYKILKIKMNFILFEFCFPLLCYTQDDVELWTTDPARFARNHLWMYEAQAQGCAVEFIQHLAKLRGRDFFAPLLQFAQEVLVMHQVATTSTAQVGEGTPVPLSNDNTLTLDQKKDGALFLVGSIACRLTSKKRNLQVEKFLRDHVMKELFNMTNPFLRLRACWTYSEFLRKCCAGEEDGSKGYIFKDTVQLLEVFERISDLLNDKETPVRISAAICIQSLIRMSNDCQALEDKMREKLPKILESLVRIINEAKWNEYALSALEELVLKFDKEFSPFAVSLLSCLTDALNRVYSSESPDASPYKAGSPLSILSSEDAENEEDLFSWTDSVFQTISTILSSLSEPKFKDVWITITPFFIPILDKLLLEANYQQLEDALVTLTYLTSFSPLLSAPVDLWKYFDQLFILVCGTENIRRPLGSTLGEGCAASDLYIMHPSLFNYMRRDPEGFLHGVGCAGGQSRVEMMLKMVECALKGSQADSPSVAIDVLSLMFESFIGKAPLADHLIGPSLKLVWDYRQSVNDSFANNENHSKPKLAMTERRFFLSPFGKMIGLMVVYNWHALLRSLNELNLNSEVSMVFQKATSQVATYTAAKSVVLGLAQILDLLSKGQGPILGYTDASKAVMALAEVLKSSVQLKKKEENDWMGSEESTDSDDDSEQDLDETQDRTVPVRKGILNYFNQADDSDDDDESSDDYTISDEENSFFVDQDSPLNDINELEVVQRFLVSMPNVFTNALGVQDASLLEKFISAESERRTALADQKKKEEE